MEKQNEIQFLLTESGVNVENMSPKILLVIVDAIIMWAESAKLSSMVGLSSPEKADLNIQWVQDKFFGEAQQFLTDNVENMNSIKCDCPDCSIHDQFSNISPEDIVGR